MAPQQRSGRQWQHVLRRVSHRQPEQARPASPPPKSGAERRLGVDLRSVPPITATHCAYTSREQAVNRTCRMYSTASAVLRRVLQASCVLLCDKEATAIASGEVLPDALFEVSRGIYASGTLLRVGLIWSSGAPACLPTRLQRALIAAAPTHTASCLQRCRSAYKPAGALFVAIHFIRACCTYDCTWCVPGSIPQSIAA